MIKSHTVVFPDAVPPATPIKNGSLLPPHIDTRSSVFVAYSPFRPRRAFPAEQFASSIFVKYLVGDPESTPATSSKPAIDFDTPLVGDGVDTSSSTTPVVVAIVAIVVVAAADIPDDKCDALGGVDGIAWCGWCVLGDV
jgi:hypothetical protein